MDTMKNILVTRPLSETQLELASGLGLNPIIVPAIDITFREKGSSIQQTIDDTENPVFIFTSKNGVRAIEQFLEHGGKLPGDAPIYTVGQKTAECLSNSGFSSKSPNEQNGTGLAQLILQDMLSGKLAADSSILHFCGNKRRDEFRQFLNDSDIEVRDIVVYKTELNNMKIPNKPFEALLFYSPSAVQAFRKSGGFRKQPLPELFAIGPTTAEELSIESGNHVHISPEPDTDVFLQFVAQVLGENEVPLRRGKAPKVQGDANYLYNNKDLKNLARNLRKNSTKSEVRLWSELLRGKQTGHTFLRQRPVLNYIADFLCKDLKLIIELDGFSHEFEQQWKKDKKRQIELEKAGFKILRFSDDDVMNDLRNVETEILYWIKKLEKNCPPSKGGIF